MPVYRVTNIRTGQHGTYIEPTDRAAWLSYRLGHPDDAFARLEFRSSTVPATHHYSIEEIEPDSGALKLGVYLTMLRAFDGEAESPR